MVIKQFWFERRRQRTLFKFQEKSTRINKSIQRMTFLPTSLRTHSTLRLLNTNKNALRIRIQNRCLISNRGRAVYQNLRLSRIYIKSWVKQGLIPRFIKASW